MSDWKSFCLGDVCDTISETYRRKSERVTLINTSDVQNGKILNHDSVPNKNLKGQFKKTFQKDDILFSEIRPINRRCAFVDFENTQDYIASTKLMVLRAKKEEILPRYLYFFLTSENVLRELQHLAETRSGTFPQITFDSELASFPISLPPLETQKKIAAVLSALDDKIELNRRFISLGLLTLNLSAAQCPMIGSLKILGNVTDNIRERITNFNTPVFSAVNTGRLVLSDEFFYKRVYSKDIKKYLLVREGDFAYNPARINIGSIGLNDFGYEGCVSPVYVVVRVNANYRAFFRFYFKTKTFAEECLSRGSGSVRQSLNYDDFSLIEMIYPSNEYARKFNELWENYFFVIQNISRENQKLGELRDALLPRLMSGEIDVSKVEI